MKVLCGTVMVFCLFFGASLNAADTYDPNDSPCEATQKTIQSLHNAVQIWFLQNRRYPTTQEGLKALLKPGQMMGPIMQKSPKDAWGNEFIYELKKVANKPKVVILSKGPDRKLKTADDISKTHKDAKACLSASKD